MYEELVLRLRTQQSVYEKADAFNLADDARQAADAIEELQAQIDGWIEQERNALLKSIPKWVPVTERLPENDCNCIVFSDGYVKESHFYFGKFYDPIEDYMRYKATHWMPLPMPPKEETE